MPIAPATQGFRLNQFPTLRPIDPADFAATNPIEAYMRTRLAAAQDLRIAEEQRKAEVAKAVQPYLPALEVAKVQQEGMNVPVLGQTERDVARAKSAESGGVIQTTPSKIASTIATNAATIEEKLNEKALAAQKFQTEAAELNARALAASSAIDMADLKQKAEDARLRAQILEAESRGAKKQIRLSGDGRFVETSMVFPDKSEMSVSSEELSTPTQAKAASELEAAKLEVVKSQAARNLRNTPPPPKVISYTSQIDPNTGMTTRTPGDVLDHEWSVKDNTWKGVVINYDAFVKKHGPDAPSVLTDVYGGESSGQSGATSNEEIAIRFKRLPDGIKTAIRAELASLGTIPDEQLAAETMKRIIEAERGLMAAPVVPPSPVVPVPVAPPPVSTTNNPRLLDLSREKIAGRLTQEQVDEEARRNRLWVPVPANT
jgi:hypothetical protein